MLNHRTRGLVSYWIGVGMTLACIALVVLGHTRPSWRSEFTTGPLIWLCAGGAIAAFLGVELCTSISAGSYQPRPPRETQHPHGAQQRTNSSAVASQPPLPPSQPSPIGQQTRSSGAVRSARVLSDQSFPEPGPDVLANRLTTSQ